MYIGVIVFTASLLVAVFIKAPPQRREPRHMASLKTQRGKRISTPVNL
jgi:hypothetical protein